MHNRKNIILDYMFIFIPIVCWDVFGPCFVMQYLVPFSSLSITSLGKTGQVVLL